MNALYDRNGDEERWLLRRHERKLRPAADTSAKRKPQIAASAAERSVSEFVLESALARAEETLNRFLVRFAFHSQQADASQTTRGAQRKSGQKAVKRQRVIRTACERLQRFTGCKDLHA